jgi:hypothetical protein
MRFNTRIKEQKSAYDPVVQRSMSWTRRFICSYSSDPIEPLVAYMRMRLREEGLMRRILPPVPLDSFIAT